MANNALATLDEGTREVAAQIKSVLNFQGNDADLALFATVARRMNLDPFSKQIYAVFRGGRMVIQTGIDGYRAIAFRTGALDAIGEPEFGPVEKGHPAYAKVAVYRKGSAHPTVGVAYWDEYCQLNSSGTPMGLWSKMPRTMLAKCAESQALRKAFPEALSGLYTDEEMSQAEAPAALPAPKAITPVVETIAAETGTAEVAPIVEIEVSPEIADRYNSEPANAGQIQLVRDLIERLREFGHDKASIEGVEKKAGKKLKAMNKGEINELSERLLVMVEKLSAEKAAA
jgi:phage recombination protein Bet